LTIRIRLIETEVSVAVFAVAFRGPTGWLPIRLPIASAVAVWLYIEVQVCLMLSGSIVSLSA
jgi:hypothetical protein